MADAAPSADGSDAAHGSDDADAANAAEAHGIRAVAAAATVRGRAIAREVDLWQQRQPVIAFPWSVYRKYADDSGSRFAAQMAYYTLFSIAPLLLAFSALVGRFLQNEPELRERIIEATLGAFPEVAASVNNAIEELPSGGTAFWIGVLAALWAGLGVTESAQFAFNQIWAVPWRIRPGFFPRQVRALLMTFVLYTGLLGYGLIAAWAGLATNRPGLVRFLILLGAATLLFLVVLVSYWVLCGRSLSYWQIWPGTLTFIGVTMVVIPFLSSWFARVVENASSLYGALATVIGVLTLFYMTAVLFIFTAEINAVRAWRLWPRGLFPDWLSHADRQSYAVLAPVEERMPEQRVITYFGVMDDGVRRELGPELPNNRFTYVDGPPAFVLDDPETVLMDYYVEGREPYVVINPYQRPSEEHSGQAERPG